MKKICKPWLPAILCLLGTDAIACESLINFKRSEPLTMEQAEQRLSGFLLSENNHARTDTTAAADINASIDCYLGRQSVVYPALQAPRRVLQAMVLDITAAASREQQRAAVETLSAAINRDAGTGFVQLPAEDNKLLEFDLYGDFLVPVCSGLADQACSDATAVAAHLWWISGHYRGFADAYNSDDVAASLAYTARLKRQWKSYKDDTILLWPQEVLLNSLVYKPSEQGLSEPPAYKLLTLRPSLGLTYLSQQSHRIQPTINVDILGIYWWRYGGADGASAGPGRGIATTLVWDGSDTAWGLTYHHNPAWSATIGHGDDNDVVISLSFQLAGWFLQR